MLLFANFQQMVVSVIWQAIDELGGSSMTEKVLRIVSHRLAEHYSEKITATDPKERLKQFISILETEGGLLDLVSKGDQLTVTKRNCDFASRLDDQRHVCAIDLELMAEIVGCAGRTDGYSQMHRADSATPAAPAAKGYVASKRSQVFHKADCKSAAKTAEKNLVRYANREEAVQAGKKPCAECRP